MKSDKGARKEVDGNECAVANSHSFSAIADIQLPAHTHSSRFTLHFSLLILLIALAAIGGCAPRQQIVFERPKALSQEEWTTMFRNRIQAWQSYQTQVHIRAESPKGKFSFRAVLLASLPDRYRLEAFNPFGQTASLLILDRQQQQFSLLVPSEKVLYSAAKAETLVEHFLGVSIPLEILGYSLVASVPPDHVDNLIVAPHDSEWIGHSRGTAKGWSFTWRFLPQPPALQSISVTEGAHHYSIFYEPAVALDVRNIPGKITFKSPQWHMEVTLDQTRSSTTLQDSIFTPAVSAGIRRVDLDKDKPL